MADVCQVNNMFSSFAPFTTTTKAISLFIIGKLCAFVKSLHSEKQIANLLLFSGVSC